MKIFNYCNSPFQNGEADEYRVICKDGEIGIHKFCLGHSSYYYKQCKARENFDGEGKGYDVITT